MFYILVIGLYLSFVGLVLYGCRRILKVGVAWGAIIVVLLILAPFWDVFVTKGIMMNFERHNTPLQEISRTIEKTESVLWLDDVWPGFDEYGRHWMVEYYLDGINLKILALNDQDGRIYLYKASEENFEESERIRPEHEKLQRSIIELENKAKEVGMSGGDNTKMWYEIREKHYPRLKKLGYKNARKNEIDAIFSNPTIYESRDHLPPTNYLVHLKQIHIEEWQKEFLWCDEITIQDQREAIPIAFSKRCLGYNPKVGFNPIGKGAPFYGGSRLGDERVYEFDDKVLFGYAKVSSSYETTRNNLRR